MKTIIITFLLITGAISYGKTPVIYKEMNVSAYCLCEKCCEKWSKVYPRRTASGHIIKKDDKFVAAPKNYKFGTTMNIKGYGIVKVLDRGGAIKGNKLDLFFSAHKEALKWGRRKIIVEIYKD